MLGGKDGLALISANGVSVGQAALVVARAARVAEAADVAAALSMEATGANTSVLDPQSGSHRSRRYYAKSHLTASSSTSAWLREA